MLNILKTAGRKQLINRDIILEHARPIDIFCHYIDDLVVGQPRNSPLRDDDDIPSFGVFRTKQGDHMYNDFVLGAGNCFMFVKKLFKLSRWWDVYSKIAYDMGFAGNYVISKHINSITPVPEARTMVVKERKSIDLRVTKRPFDSHDIDFWNQFGIKLYTLIRYDVEPICEIKYIINKRIMYLPVHKYAYCFKELKDKRPTYKIYQPFSVHKWLSTHNNSIWQGWKQLPKSGDILIITKSLKDIMTIVSISNYSSVALQSESTKPKGKIMDELYQRFNHIFVLYDNDYDKKDNPGKTMGMKFEAEYGAYFICIPDSYKCKDISDFVKRYGEDRARNLLINMINIRLKKLNNEDYRGIT